MDTKRVHYAFAGASFIVSLIVYMMTMQPSIPFWDCGEFAASAWALQIPHPPGSPLWTLVGRIAMILPTYDDPVARYNFFSVLSSALTIMVLYLTVARLIKIWRGVPKTTTDIVVTFGGAFIAAMSYTFTDSFWFNALECEVYAFGSLFIALIPWVMLVWYDHADEEHNEKYMLLAAYLIGLSMGVHQLALLTIFPSFMLIYYRRREQVTIGSWIGMAVSAVIAFLIAYKLVLSKLVEWMATTPIISVGIIAASIFGIWWSQKNHKALLNLSLWSAMLIFLGYSTYTLLMVRAAQNPPMNQWQVSSFDNITRYINREQYGDRGQWPRRQPSEPGEENGPMFTNYTSEMDFFWRYQTNHMYSRYLMWNFVGRVSQRQDSGFDLSKTWGIPLLLGMFGMYWHFRRDPKRALSMFAMFAMLGWMTAWYQNQQEPQPRERDYFYVGAFYVYAMWVGIGAVGIFEFLKEKRKQRSSEQENDTASDTPSAGLAFAVIAGGLLIAPINQCIGLAGLLSGQSFEKSSKWAEYDRSHNNIPLEYAYNVLQSCEPDAVLFTAGDNDTFPLWCAQDVYGIRRDVRIVNLSLGNMSWYIRQLKNDVWGVGKKLNLPGFDDKLLAGRDDSPEGVRPYRSAATEASVEITAETMRRFTGVVDAQPTMLRWMFTGQYNLGKGEYYIAVADQLVRSIVQGNMNTRPIYFANVVPDNYFTGLRQYVASEGFARRLTPLIQQARVRRFDEAVNEEAMSKMLLTFTDEYSLTPKRAMHLNTFSDPKAHWSNDDRTNDPSFVSYQGSYINLAGYYIKMEELARAKAVLDTLRRRIPPDRVKYLGITAQLIAKQYRRVGDDSSAKYFAGVALNDFQMRIAEAKTEGEVSNELGAYLFAVESLLEMEDPQGALDLMMPVMPRLNPRDKPQFELRQLQAEAMLNEQKGDKKAALDKYNQLFSKYGSAMAGTPEYQQDLQMLIQKRFDLMHALGMSKDTIR